MSDGIVIVKINKAFIFAAFLYFALNELSDAMAAFLLVFMVIEVAELIALAISSRKKQDDVHLYTREDINYIRSSDLADSKGITYVEYEE